MLIKDQTGIGLLEVMIALLLLAIAVLGFSAMQMMAIKATDESLIRSDALVAMRNISEDMRLNPTPSYKQKYQAYISGFAKNKKNAQAYLTALGRKPKNCSQLSCTLDEQAEYNAHISMLLAAQSQVILNAIDCPGATKSSSNLDRICLVASWGETLPTVGANKTDCMDANGIYKPGSSCFVMETY